MRFQIIFLFLVGFSISLNAQEVAQDEYSICPILLGTEAPQVELTSIEGKVVSLSAIIAQKPTVLVFYRGGWCPYCMVHLKELKDAIKPLGEMGYQILAVSPDKVEKAMKTSDKKNLPYAIYSDSNLEAAKAFGIAFQVGEAYLKKLKKYGISLEKASGKDHNWLPVPAVFLFGKDQTVQYSYVNPNYKVRLSSEVLLAAAKAAMKD